MKAIVNNTPLGAILYEESFWTGKKNIYINGKKLEKVNKRTYVLYELEDKKYFYVKGNYVMGVKLQADGTTVNIIKNTWYEILCSCLILLIGLIWGNSVVLCSIIPMIGGAIGGALYAIMSLANLVAMKSTDKIWLKLIIWLLMFIITFVIGFVLALLFMSILINML